MRLSTHFLLLLILALFGLGCTPETRQSFEESQPWLKPEVVAASTSPNDLTVVRYRDALPRIDYDGNYSAIPGWKVIAYNPDNTVYAHTFVQDSK